MTSSAPTSTSFAYVECDIPGEQTLVEPAMTLATLSDIWKKSLELEQPDFEVSQDDL